MVGVLSRFACRPREVQMQRCGSLRHVAVEISGHGGGVYARTIIGDSYSAGVGFFHGILPTGIYRYPSYWARVGYGGGVW